jgi:RNA polymerase sigma-70 factor (ECF subfamily)
MAPETDGERAVTLGLDPDGFRRFYELALPRVYGYLLHRCGSSATAEDLTQETFLAAVVEVRKERQVEEPFAWIMGIARHKLLDYYRRQDRARSQVASKLPDVPVERSVDGDGRAITALASVPRDQRIALVLRHVDGLSVPEVAAALGRSVEAAESLLARGRVRFRQAYMEVSA